MVFLCRTIAELRVGSLAGYWRSLSRKKCLLSSVGSFLGRTIGLCSSAFFWGIIVRSCCGCAVLFREED